MARQNRSQQNFTIREFTHDPILFAEGVLGYDVWSAQARIMRAISRPHAKVAVKGTHGAGKALDLETPIPTPLGWTTMGSLVPGDVVFNEDGEEVAVLAVSPVEERESFRIVFDTGESIVASDDHLWSVLDLAHRPYRGKGRKKRPKITDWRERWDVTKIVTTRDMASSILCGRQYRWRVPTARAIEGGKWTFPTPAYTFGAWIGDGTTTKAEITCGHADLEEMHSRIGGRVSYHKDRAPSIFFGRTQVECPSRITGGKKRIPLEVMRASASDRFLVLQGIMDTDGWVLHRGGAAVCVSVVVEDLATDIRELITSLGWKSFLSSKPARLYGKDCGTSYIITFTPSVCPFLLERKVRDWSPPANQASRHTQRTIVAIEPIGVRKVRCIKVDSPRSLYLAGNGLIPTHNTSVAASIALWWLLHEETSRVVTIAPTFKQVERQIWSEIHTTVRRSLVPLSFPTVNQTEIRINELNFILGMATHESERLQGFHGNVMIIVDEAPGIQPDLWNAITGIEAAGDVRVLALGNPTIAAGPFYEAFGKNAISWKGFTIDAMDTPNLMPLGRNPEERLARLLTLDEDQLLHNPIPYLINRKWVRDRYYEWGVTSPLWQGRVRAQFPEQSPDALYFLSDLLAAQQETMDDEESPLVAGLDVAGPGEDETVLVLRSGRRIVRMWHWTIADPRGDVVAVLNAYRSRITMVNVDVIGQGYYFAQHLRDQDFPVNEVNVSNSPSDPERFYNYKSEIYWNMRERLTSRQVIGITDDLTYSQFSMVRYTHDAKGRIVIESKEAMRKRGAASPDRMEATILAFIDPEDSFFDGQPPLQARYTAGYVQGGTVSGQRMLGYR